MWPASRRPKDLGLGASSPLAPFEGDNVTTPFFIKVQAD